MNSPFFRLRFAFVVFAAVVSLLMAGCPQSSKESKNEEDLVKTVRNFNSMFRWGDYKVASVWIVPNAKEAYWNFVDKYQHALRIIDFEVRDASLDESMKKGTVLVSFRYYLTENPNVQTRIIKQNWIFLENKKAWVILETGFHQLTTVDTKS